jgi:heme/copper-type cytochrome/quinol oxidase subunit 2
MTAAPAWAAVAMHPDLFMTIVFVSLVVAFGLAGLVVVHARRRERAAAEQDAAARQGGGNRIGHR